MKSSVFLPYFVFASALFAAAPKSRTWGELAQEVRPEWTVRVVLPDGSVVEGKPARFEPESLSMRITHTSNKSLHPKGDIAIPREQVKVVGIRKNRHKGRLMGTLIPAAAGVAAGIAVSAGSDDFIIPSEAFGAGFGAAVALVGGTAGYFIGRAFDRRFETVSIAPEPRGPSTRMSAVSAR